MIAGLGQNLRNLFSYLSPLRVLLPIIFVVNVFFYATGESLWSFDLFLFRLSLTLGGFEKSLLICFRLLSVASIAALLVVTTSIEEFEFGLKKLGVPWKVAFTFSLALKFLPDMKRIYREIEEAQIGRGVKKDGNPFEKFKRKVNILIPFLAKVARYGFNISEVLKARNFGTERTCLWEVENS